MTPEGRICITEQALASALQELALWPEELWTEFGLLARADEDGRSHLRFTHHRDAARGGRALGAAVAADHAPGLRTPSPGAARGIQRSVTRTRHRWWQRRCANGSNAHCNWEPSRSSRRPTPKTGLRQLLAALGPAGAVEVDTIQFPSRFDAPAEKSDEQPAAAPARPLAKVEAPDAPAGGAFFAVVRPRRFQYLPRRRQITPEALAASRRPHADRRRGSAVGRTEIRVRRASST